MDSNQKPQMDATPAQKAASAVQRYLEQCSSRERWPEETELDAIICEHFAPVLRTRYAKLVARIQELERKCA